MKTIDDIKSNHLNNYVCTYTTVNEDGTDRAGFVFAAHPETAFSDRDTALAWSLSQPETHYASVSRVEVFDTIAKDIILAVTIDDWLDWSDQQRPMELKKTRYTAPALIGLEDFEPFEGTWTTDREHWREALADIQKEFSKRVDYPVKVELFQANGRAATDNTRDGQLLITRK